MIAAETSAGKRLQRNAAPVAAPSHVAGRNGLRQFALQAVFYALLFAAWWIVAERGIFPAYLLPSPKDVGEYLQTSVAEERLLPAIGTSTLRGAIGYVVALVVGTVLGLALARIRLLDDTVGGAVVGLQSLPSICWFPLALIWFGLNEKAVQFVVIMGAVFAVTLAVRSGVRNLPPLTLRAAQSLGATGINLWIHVLLPAILPAFLSGMRQGWAFAWRSLMAAELLSQSLKEGVGHLLATGRDLNDMAMVLGVIAVILFLGIAVDRIVFAPLEKIVASRWGVEGA
ncbi:MAG: ABC transporter permease [Armatimonadetes bacterium]|nr:ABC transporter permease [Armatimonadota bacterium]